MVYSGKKITNLSDPLIKTPLEYLFHSIQHPKSEIESMIRNLRLVQSIDPKRYVSLKRELPYFVCGAFNPPYRRTENFAYTEFFIVDIDHISMKGLNLETLKKDLKQDQSVFMLFLSPSEDGLKVMFHFKERCYDAGLYSIFYKFFVKRFSAQYHLEQVVDTQTSDVCRACFISMDSDIYYNPEAEPVDWNSYLDLEDTTSLFDEKKRVEKEMRVAAEKQQEWLPEKDHEPDGDSIMQIKAILKMRMGKAEKEKVSAYVPSQLVEIIDDLKKYIEGLGITVMEIININYGKKIRMKMGQRQAEVNVFYGKKGFSVVKSPRCGTNSELNDITSDVIRSFFIQ